MYIIILFIIHPFIHYFPLAYLLLLRYSTSCTAGSRGTSPADRMPAAEVRDSSLRAYASGKITVCGIRGLLPAAESSVFQLTKIFKGA